MVKAQRDEGLSTN